MCRYEPVIEAVVGIPVFPFIIVVFVAIVDSVNVDPRPETEGPS